MGMREPIDKKTDLLAGEIVDGAFCVHRELGPGLLESVYEACLAYELKKRSIEFQRQASLPTVYDGQQMDEKLRLDLLVGGKVVVEVKAVDRVLPVFEAQLLTYLKLSKLRLGLLINFNVPLIKDGIKRIAL